VFPRDTVCLRNISINTLHKGYDDGDDDDDDDNNNNNNNNNTNNFGSDLSTSISYAFLIIKSVNGEVSVKCACVDSDHGWGRWPINEDDSCEGTEYVTRDNRQGGPSTISCAG